jgi:hypothetical protein
MGPPGPDDGTVLKWHVGGLLEGASYVRNDAGEFNGSGFICAEDHCAGPPDLTPSKGWTLMVSKGERGPQGPTGPTGPTH